MLKVSAKSFTKSRVTQGILSTLTFFDLYKLPISSRRLWELLYRTEASLPELESELARLTKLDLVVFREGMFALNDWDSRAYINNQAAISKRWNKIKKYYWLLSSIPFVEHLAVINSMAIGNANSESDIDFFVITKPNRLYFVRTWIILLFRALGVYKKGKKLNEKFCFGFYITSDKMSVRDLQIPNEDPYFVFWMATMMPIMGLNKYEMFMKENRWIYTWFPNFKTAYRIDNLKSLKPSDKLRKFLEIVFTIPAVVLEPLLRKVHVRHTYNLPENSWKSSTTIANSNILKLHALDPRKELRQKFHQTLQNYL